jgi:hypothetical protein
MRGTQDKTEERQTTRKTHSKTTLALLGDGISRSAPPYVTSLLRKKIKEHLGDQGFRRKETPSLERLFHAMLRSLNILRRTQLMVSETSLFSLFLEIRLRGHAGILLSFFACM